MPEDILKIFDQEPIIRSDGTPLRDYFYIEDVVDAYLTLGENLDREEIKGQAFNFGTGNPTKVIDLVNMMIVISGKTHLKAKILNEATGEIEKQYLSCEKAEKLLKWKSKFDLKETLQKTYEWYKKFLESNK